GRVRGSGRRREAQEEHGRGGPGDGDARREQGRPVRRHFPGVVGGQEDAHPGSLWPL
ncbi:hypothetical protein OC835_007330, partial [Tilletia horrida]